MTESESGVQGSQREAAIMGRPPADPEVLSSDADRSRAARAISQSIDTNPPRILVRAFKGLLKGLSEIEDISAVVFVPGRRRASALDVYALWSRPMDLAVDAQAMRRVHDLHAQHLQRFEDWLDSHCRIIDFRQAQSPQGLISRICTDDGPRAANAVLAYKPSR